jgi:hypothetical protein
MTQAVRTLIVMTMLTIPLSGNAGPKVNFSQSQVCRATIAAIMGRDPRIIKVTKEEAGVVYVSYVRPGDGTVWNQRCRFEGARVIWATETGRWRDHPLNEVISYSSTSTAVTIQQKFGDGSASTKMYTHADLGKS